MIRSNEANEPLKLGRFASLVGKRALGVLMSIGSYAAAREEGLLNGRKDYIRRKGHVVYLRSNVIAVCCLALSSQRRIKLGDRAALVQD